MSIPDSTLIAEGRRREAEEQDRRRQNQQHWHQQHQQQQPSRPTPSSPARQQQQPWRPYPDFPSSPLMMTSPAATSMRQRRFLPSPSSQGGPTTTPRAALPRPRPIETNDDDDDDDNDIDVDVLGEGRATTTWAGGRQQQYQHQHQQQYQHQHQYQQHQHQQNRQNHHYPQQQVLSPNSQVRFEDQMRKDRLRDMIHEWSADDEHSPAFLFDEADDLDLDLDDCQEDRDLVGGGTTTTTTTPLPTEAQLVLLCLDHLRDLLRSYADRRYDDADDDPGGGSLRDAEGLDPDCVALAAWALSRSFVGPHASVLVRRVGGGGGGGGGNDASTLRARSDGGTIEDGEGEEEEEEEERVSGFVLSERIVLPTMEEIVDEVLLRRPGVTARRRRRRRRAKERRTTPSSGDGGWAADDDDHDDDDEDEEEDDNGPRYEHDDEHPSNMHRFYLLDGLASSTSCEAIAAELGGREGTGRGGGHAVGKMGGGLVTPRGLGLVTPRVGSTPPAIATTTPTPTPTTVANADVVVDARGDPLTLAVIASAGLVGLRARSRLDATRGMVRSELFHQFVKAASAGGFFQEKKSTGTRGCHPAADGGGGVGVGGGGRGSTEDVIDGGEDDARRRSRLSYEEKYRKVVGKFQTKLAVKEAMSQSLLLTQQRHQHQQYGGAHPPDHRLGNAIRIMSGNYSVLSVPGVGAAGMGNAAYSIMSVGDVVERRLRRRERRMENAKRSKPQRTIGFDGGDGEEYLDNDQEGGDRPVTEEKKYSHSWVDAVPSVESNLSEKMPSGHDRSDVLVEGGAGERETTPSSAKESEDPTRPSPAAVASLPNCLVGADGVAEVGAAAAVVNLPHYQEAERLNSLGNSLMQQKQFQDALDTYTLAVNLAPAGPKSHVYYSNRSAAYLSLNMNEHSIRDCERSIALIKPTEGGGGGGGEYYSKAHSRLGLAYFACGRYREAVDAYEKSLEMEPKNKWTRDHLEKAKARIISSTIDGNEDTKAASGSPEESTANIMVGGSEEEEEGGGGGGVAPNEQEIIAEQLLRADDHKNKGNVLMSSKQYTEALHQYDLAIKTSPSGPNSYVYYSNRAAAFCYLADYVKAMNDCRRSIDLNPMYEKAYSRLGLSLFFQGEYEGAISAYETSLALDPSNKASLSYLSKAKSRLAEQQNEKKAREEKDMKTSEEREKTRRRMEWLHLQKSKGQQQQYQVSTGGIAENEDGEGDSQRNAGLASIVTDEIVEVSAKSGDIN